jgi:ferredoxin
MKVSIDEDRCQGHARCWALCPEVFALDDEGLGHVKVDEVPTGLEAKAQEAADNCPERAITVS